MRTTISIDGEILEAAKRKARQTGRTLGAVIEAALRRDLASPPPARERRAVPVFGAGTGPRAGVDLTTNRGLQEALDGDQPLDELR